MNISFTSLPYVNILIRSLISCILVVFSVQYFNLSEDINSLIKDFRTPVIEDEGDLEDRQDWSDADVQKLDALLKTLMIALNPPEEPWQSIKIVSGTDWDTAEVELEVDNEVLKSAVETLADLEKFVGYEYVMSRQHGYRMDDWEK